MRAMWHPVILSCLLWGACVRFGFGSAEDRAVDLGRETGQRDSSATGDRDDAHFSRDGNKPQDGRRDGPLVIDGRKADLLPKMDSTFKPDASRPDARSADGAVVGPGCNPSFAVLEKSFSAGMVVCRSSSAQSYSQCQAEPKLCAAGWQLCPAVTYQALFASSGPGLPEAAWIAGCIREGGATFAPTNSTCSTCGGATAPYVTYDWTCTGAANNGGTVPHVGVTSAGSCHRVGVNTAAVAAFWGDAAAAFPLSRAFCCK